MPIDHSENLIPNEQRTPSERRANASKAGKASGEARRKKKKLKQELANILALSVKNPKMLDNITKLGIDTQDADMQTVMTAAMVVQACNGNVKAYIAIRDTLGETPTQKVSVDGEMSVQTDAARAAYEKAAAAIKLKDAEDKAE